MLRFSLNRIFFEDNLIQKIKSLEIFKDQVALWKEIYSRLSLYKKWRLILVDFEKLSGTYVICAGGFDLGNVNGIEINTVNWQITHLHVKLSKPASEDLGFKKRFRSSTVCLPISLVATTGDNILLNKSIDELSRHPEISECKE
jgi:sporulation protein YlmC with PRC-barrel domain